MTLDAVIRRAIRAAPCTMRALARDAEVSHVMLQGIVKGRERATVRIALKVALALDEWSVRCREEAKRLRSAVKNHSRKEET